MNGVGVEISDSKTPLGLTLSLSVWYLNRGLDRAVGDSMQLGGDILGNIGQSAGYLAYGDDVMSTVGDHPGSIGRLLSVAQIGNNIYQGKILDAVVAGLKTSYTYVMGKAASKHSSSVMSASRGKQ